MLHHGSGVSIPNSYRVLLHACNASSEETYQTESALAITCSRWFWRDLLDRILSVLDSLFLHLRSCIYTVHFVVHTLHLCFTLTPSSLEGLPLFGLSNFVRLLRGAFLCSHTTSLFCSEPTLQLVALVATAVALTAYARMHFVVGHHFLDSPEKGMCFSSWLFLKVPILRRHTELEDQDYQPPPSLPTKVVPSRWHTHTLHVLHCVWIGENKELWSSPFFIGFRNLTTFFKIISFGGLTDLAT